MTYAFLSCLEKQQFNTIGKYSQLFVLFILFFMSCQSSCQSLLYGK